MKGTFLLRLCVGVVACMAVLATLLEIAREDDIDVQPIPEMTATNHPLRAELQRCRDIGDAALDDQACANVWAETRRRFLTPVPQSETRE